MSTPAFDQSFWDDLWSRTLRENADQVSRRPPNAHLVSELAGLAPGRAVDAGCGHGVDALWLAGHGWRVTGVDFAPAALEQARSMARAAGGGIAERVDFIEADLSSWEPESERFDLVVSLYVHAGDSAEQQVQRLARGVAPGGTLFLVGHQPLDPETGDPTRAAGQVQVSLAAARGALDPREWSFVVEEERRRAAGGGVDAVIRAVRTRR